MPVVTEQQQAKSKRQAKQIKSNPTQVKGKIDLPLRAESSMQYPLHAPESEQASANGSAGDNNEKDSRIPSALESQQGNSQERQQDICENISGGKGFHIVLPHDAERAADSAAGSFFRSFLKLSSSASSMVN